MRTEQQNYLQKAQEMTFMMDVEEQAAKAASSLWQADESEIRLANLRQEAECLLKEWQQSLKIIDNEIYKASKQREKICYIDTVYFLFAWGDKKISEKEYFLRKEQQVKIEKILKSLQQTQDTMIEAIAYLHEYLYPSQEYNATQSTPQTPQMLALEYVRNILQQEGDVMFEEFKRSIKGDLQSAIKEMRAEACWDVLDEAFYRLENVKGLPLNIAAVNELEKEYREYPAMSQDFQIIINTVRDYFLYW